VLTPAGEQKLSPSKPSDSRSSSLESQDNTNVKRKRKEVTEEELLDSDDNAQTSDTPEEPVFSHAERRRRKKEQKLAANLKEEEGSAMKKRKLKDGSAKAVVPMKRQNSVWIGNMSFKTTQEDLRTFFGDVGEITRINMPTKRAAGPGLKPENRGYVHRRSPSLTTF
jgi:RNA recognition motif-containing protein